MSDPNIHYCDGAGYVVSQKEWLPAESFDYHWPAGPVIGCNRLQCENCNQAVVITDGNDDARDYVCACHSERVTSLASTLQILNPFTEERLPWRCQGHPTVELPLTLDGIRVDSAAGWDVLVRDVWQQKLATPTFTGTEKLPTFWIERLYWIQKMGPDRDALSNAIAQLLDDGNINLRASAVSFFWRAPYAAGAERVVDIAGRQPELFIGVMHPHGGQHTIWDYAADILGSRSTVDQTGKPRDQQASDLLRNRALVPPGIAAALYGLARRDRAWVSAHADEIVAASADWAAALYVLRSLPDARVAELAASIEKRGAATHEMVLDQLRLNHSEDTIRAYEARRAAG